MPKPKEPICINEGDTFSKTIKFSNDDGTDVDITGWTIYVTVKDKLSDSDVDAILSQDVTSHDDAVAGETSFSFPPSETEGIAGTYWFEIKYENDTSDVTTILRERLDVTDSVRSSI